MGLNYMSRSEDKGSYIMKSRMWNLLYDCRTWDQLGSQEKGGPLWPQMRTSVVGWQVPTAIRHLLSRVAEGQCFFPRVELRHRQERLVFDHPVGDLLSKFHHFGGGGSCSCGIATGGGICGSWASCGTC
jgi:hypothetical protein